MATEADIRGLLASFLTEHREQILEALVEDLKAGGATDLLVAHGELLDVARVEIGDPSPRRTVVAIYKVLAGGDRWRNAGSIIPGQITLWVLVHRMLRQEEGPHRNPEVIHQVLAMAGDALDGILGTLLDVAEGGEASVEFPMWRTRVAMGRTYREFNLLNLLIRDLLSEPNPKRMLEVLENGLLDIFHIRSLMIASVNAREGFLEVVRAYPTSVGGQDPIGWRYPLSHPDILCDVARSGRTEVIDGWDPRFYEWEMRADGTAVYRQRPRDCNEGNTAYFIPILAQDRAIGVIGTGSTEASKGIVLREIKRMRPFLDQVGNTLLHCEKITTLRQATERLRQSDQFRQSVFDAVPEHLAILDEKGKIIDVNRPWREFAAANGSPGILWEGADYLAVCDLARGEDAGIATRFAAGIRAVMSGATDTFAVEYPCHSPSVQRWFLGSVNKFPGERSARIVVSHRDITQRKLAELKLKETETYLRSVLINLPITIFALNPDGIFTLSEGKELERVGLKPGDHVGDSALDLYPSLLFTETSGRMTTAKEILRRVLAGETIHATDELRGLYFDNHIGPIRDLNDRITGVVGIAIDITDRIKMEKELGQAVEKLNLLLDLFRSIASSLDLDTILNRCLSHLKSCLPVADIAVIYLYDPQVQMLLPRAWAGYEDEAIRQIQLHPGESVSGRAFQTGKVVLMNSHEDARIYREGVRPEILSLFERARGGREIQGGVCIPLLLPNGDAIGTLTVGSTHGAPKREDLSLLEGVAAMTIAAIQNSRLYGEVVEARERLAVLSRRLLQVQEEERRRIARELHDEFGQVLTGLRLSLELGERQSADAVRDTLQDAKALIDDLSEKVRELSLEMRPSMLDDLGLLPTLLWYFRQFALRTSILVNFSHNAISGRRFHPAVETAAYRIVQESLTNVARYAKVNDVSVQVWCDGRMLNLHVEDQGEGFEPERALSVADTSGLSGMHERAEMLGGELRVVSVPGMGTCVIATLPTGGA